ncbi:MAG TPA: PrsW family intramembrane metalloprotease [Firmicutes bacterium]|nr:PrsW family intramembrane metalloprotease [Bacillota bacterium]
MEFILLIFSVFAAIVPYFFLILFIWWLDRNEREPFGYVISSLVWGGVGAIFIGIVFSLLLLLPATFIFGNDLADLMGTIIFAPITEEIAKGIIIIILLNSLQFDNATDGFVYGAASGLGFAMTENFLYFSQAIGNVQGWLILVFLRTLFTGVMHMTTSAIFGAIVGYVKYNKSTAKKIFMPIIGLGIGMVIHSIWNITAVAQGTSKEGYPLVIGIIMLMIALAIIFVLFLLSISHEKTIIIKYLTEEAKTGLLPENHINYIANFSQRKRRGWFDSRDRGAYIDAAVHLAFRHDQLFHAGNPKKIEILKADIEKLRTKIREILIKNR